MLMTRIFTILVLVAFLPFASFGWNDSDYVLQWQLNDAGSTVDGSPSVYSFLSLEHPDDEIGVQIAVYDNSGNLVRYLNPIWEDEQGTHIETEFNDWWIGTGSDIGDTRATQGYYGPGDYMEYVYQMQVGTYDADYNFIELLYSDTDNAAGHWYDMGTILPPNTDWMPKEFYTVNPVVPTPVVPEPDSGILFLTGISILFLKRKRNAHG